LEKCREKTLIAALHSILYKDMNESTLTHIDAQAETHAYANVQAEVLTDIKNELFTPDEIDVALLLIEGKMRSEITRSLHLSAEEANKRITSIRNKVSNMGDPDPLIAAAITDYKLTSRETDMLRCLRRKMTNAQIANELFLAEPTVRIHIRNLLKKLKIDGRKDIAKWEEEFERE